ncbi:sugar ABC transporter ATP-binding protein [Eubacteriales bacterium OttesenSCG-928-N13]|nr:sugar ABC transporter ATP-binding protein [Eubacteriales bacterium OttesenSCG-928-N13]
MPDKILEITGVTKIFPGVKALDDVQFDLYPGEIHALMGENGAGKSTFIKVLTGVHQPDHGQILMDGQPVVMSDPLVAQRHGIAAIYQHLAAYPDLSVAENIFMGHELLEGPLKRINWKKTNQMARELLQSLGSSISPTERMQVLSVAQQQLVEIAKALSQNARVLIMDEPTAALSRRESEELYEIVRKLRDKGTSVILISHRFEDMYSLADRVTVLRDAKYIGTWPVDGISNEQMVKHMVGRSIEQFFPHKTAEVGKPVLRLEGLSRMGYFADVSFTLHEGEILGLTGLVGAGRTEVVEALLGITDVSAGKVFLHDKAVQIKSPHDALNLGIGLLPEDRQKQGLLLPWSIGENITLPSLDHFKKGILMDRSGERVEGERQKNLLEVKATGIDDTAASLSGGNQQKVVVGKLLAGKAKILILDEPTKGVDVGSKAQIYEIMCDLAKQGFAILMISSELPEVINMSDNIVVMREGRVSTIIPKAEATQENVLTAAMPLNKQA